MKKNIKIGIVVIIILILLGGYYAWKNPQKIGIESGYKLGTSTDNTLGKNYNLEEVALHKDKNTCWVIVSDKVYDLTTWVNQHPGGTENILSLCGMDGTAAFVGQHANNSEPQQALKSFYIGNLE